jgi:hypothetical protein
MVDGRPSMMLEQARPDSVDTIKLRGDHTAAKPHRRGPARYTIYICSTESPVVTGSPGQAGR